jgi:glycosyltransferase involved in cell wall biosynthesis
VIFLFTSSPAVSVVVPAYNGSRTILQCISSILSQEYCPIELIVVDDGSKDETGLLVKKFIETSKFSGQFTLITHEMNLGLSRSLNDAIKQAHTGFLLILHQDCEFIKNDWVERALLRMEDKRIAVVTGYYGLSDTNDETFIKRTFGVLRKQFHSRPNISCEEVTFSEGKCDLYRLDYLLKVGGFPSSFRIAGEDLIVSYKLRKIGYSILKCYDLAVIQRFTGAAETFTGNLEKEFLFGKVMGGVFAEFKFLLFKGVKASEYSGSRSLHRASQPLFVLIFLLLSLFSIAFSTLFGIVIVGLILARWLYYTIKVIKELNVYASHLDHFRLESIVIALIGILTDFAYTLGFVYGSIKYRLGKNL